MANEIFETRTLLESLEEVQAPTSFLADRYFPTTANTDVFKTEKVLVEYRKGARKVAPFISPRANGVALERYGEKMREYVPPVIGMRRTLTIDDLKRRGFGEALYTSLAPAQREATMLVNDMADLRDVNKRKLEAMAAEVLFTNALVVKEYGDDGKAIGEGKEIRFYEETTNPSIYTPTANWTTTKASGKQIIDDVAAMVKMLSKRGIPATEVLMAPDVADILLNNEYILELLDNRRFEIGSMKPIELPDGVSRVANLNIKGRNIDFLTYDQEYFDEETSAEKPYIPYGKIILLAPGCGHTVYGGITQIEDDGNFHTYEGMNVPRYIVDKYSNTKMLAVRSAPLPLPHQESPWVVATVNTKD